MRLFFLFLFFGCNALNAVLGQDRDSLTFVHHNWEISDVRDGLTWKKGHFDDLFSSQQMINILEVDLEKLRTNVRLAGLSDSLASTSAFAKKFKASAAINGGFFDMKNGGAVDFIKISSQTINLTNNTNARSNALFAFNDDSFQIVGASDSVQVYQDYDNIMRSGPLLLYKGKVITLAKNAFNDNRHPRTAIAIDNQTLYLITVDGRNAMAQGVNLNELSLILKWIGVVDAMNLDGGGSTTMFVKDHGDNGVVNYPCDNKQFDHKGERKVANVLMIL